MFNSLKVTESFSNSITTAIKSGTLSHAIILEGSDDNNRFLAAKEIAAAIMCNEKEKPCYTCSHCIKSKKEIHPDLHILEKEKDSTMIKIGAIRELKSKALLFPNEAKKSVFIIRQANLMNPQAQNALLKIFEEPSSHLCFILTCPSKSAFLDTIISRATVYSLGEEIRDATEKDSKAVTIAEELLLSLSDENEFMFIKRTAVMQKDKKLLSQVAEEMIPIVRDALILQSGGKDLLSQSDKAAIRLSRTFTQKKNLALLTALTDFSDSFKFSPNQNLSLTRLSSVLFSIKSH